MLAVSFKPSVSEYDTAIKYSLEMTKCASLQVYISVTCKLIAKPPFFRVANGDTNARCLYKFNALRVATIARMMIQPAQSVGKDGRQLTK